MPQVDFMPYLVAGQLISTADSTLIWWVGSLVRAKSQAEAIDIVIRRYPPHIRWAVGWPKATLLTEESVALRGGAPSLLDLICLNTNGELKTESM